MLQDGRGTSWLDPELADREWSANSDPAKRVGGEAAARAAGARGDLEEEDDDQEGDDADEETRGGLTYTVARARREAANAELAELKLAERRGQLVDVTTVQKGADALARIIRARVMGISDRIHAELASETDPHRVHVKLTDELRAALEELTGEFAGPDA